MKRKEQRTPGRRKGSKKWIQEEIKNETKGMNNQEKIKGGKGRKKVRKRNERKKRRNEQME